MTTIKVNTLCRIDEENPTPVKEQEIALNVTAVDPKADFQNFVLGIENYMQCCEDFGTFSDDIPEQLFVKEIHSDVKITEQQAKELLSDTFADHGDVIAYELVDSDNKSYLFGVYNAHNGYYSHVIYENGEEIDYL